MQCSLFLLFLLIYMLFKLMLQSWVYICQIALFIAFVCLNFILVYFFFLNYVSIIGFINVNYSFYYFRSCHFLFLCFILEYENFKYPFIIVVKKN